MRKPERIPEILLELYKLWSTMPDMRFWQLLFAIWYLEDEITDHWLRKIVDPFHYEDNVLLDKIKAYEQR
jgi:hypothetical protein